MVSIFLLVIGIAMLFAAFSMFTASMKVRDWPVVPGRVVDKGVRSPTVTSGASSGAVLELWVKYSYTVDGKGYIGERVDLSGINPTYIPDRARRVATAFPEDVEVHYNASDPSDAYLEPTAFGWAIFCLFAGIVCLLISVGAYFYPGKG